MVGGVTGPILPRAVSPVALAFIREYVLLVVESREMEHEISMS